MHSDFVTDTNTLQSCLTNPLVYISASPIVSLQECLSLLDAAALTSKKISVTTTETSSCSSSFPSTSANNTSHANTQSRDLQKQRPLILVAPSFSEEVIETTLLNHVNGIVSCGLVRVNDLPLDELHDLAVSCGTSVHTGHPT